MKTLIFILGVDVLGFPVVHKHHFTETKCFFTGKKPGYKITSETITLK